MPDSYPFLKGHGTENDFVLLPDHDGTAHGGLDEAAWSARVAALCDRRAGIGGDGVLRVIRTAAYAGTDPVTPDTAETEWFMDYRNADGSVSEMCGNGIRVFARHLLDEGLAVAPFAVGTRDGVKTVAVDGDLITVDLGPATALGETTVAVGTVTWWARNVDMGNPHAVAFVSDLADAGTLLEPPHHDPTLYPDGVNVEFVVRCGERHVAMRVHERGSGETRSCGTGAGAVMVATALEDGAARDVDLAYRIDVPGGTLAVTWTTDDRVLLTGPAVVLAAGTTSL